MERKILDAYDKFFKKVGNSKEFFEKSMDDIIFINEEYIAEQWNKQKTKLLNGEQLYIRGYGRDAKGTNKYKLLYSYLFHNENIEKDSTNNAIPTKLIAEYTEYSKIERDGKKIIMNYQISHLFGRTKNPLLFSALWNFAYVPKYLDPFTGHELNGKYGEEFKTVFNAFIRNKFAAYIEDYNSFVATYIEPKLEEALDNTKKKLRENKKEFHRFRNDSEKELDLL